MKRIDLSRGWELHAPGFDGTVDLPNDYAVTQPRDPNAPGGASNGFFGGGEGRYRKSLALDAAPQHYILDIDGAYMCAAVYWNGFRLVMHPHGYAPILVDLTGRARFGEANDLLIVTNGFQPSTRWYSGAGLYRDVALWEGGDVRIEPWDKFVTTPGDGRVCASYTLSADRDTTVTLRAEVREDLHIAAAAETKVTVLAGKKTAVSLDIPFPDAKRWDFDAPQLYTLHTTVTEDGNGAVLDEDDTVFGVRTLTVDAAHGLRLNGVPVKLRGGCIHHDHGALGAADYPAALRRKLTKLREAGFNAIRSAHNPPSRRLLELCDELGIAVMDEAFDCWREEKGGSLNYHLWFDGWWARDLAAMVLRDRNHPCVFSYSIGNEIPESFGTTDGAEWSARLASEVRRYDATRPVTSATWEMGGPATWAERTEGYFAPLDMAGYNYLYRRYEEDHERYPERVIWGSETHAIHFYDSWQKVRALPYVVGDFTWTAWDNLGEAGTGRAAWARDGEIRGISLAPYPWRSCYQGDFDLTGRRRPQSYFREAVMLGNRPPRIFTTHPEHTGEGFTGTGWHWYDVHESWTFGDEYIGRPVRCEVYTDSDEIAWTLNGRALGRTVPEKAVAALEVPYEPGVLTATAYKNGEPCGEASLRTVGRASQVLVRAEMPAFRADGLDLCFFGVTVADESGARVPYAAQELHASVSGGELLAFFSGDPANEDAYGSDTCHAFDGCALAVVRTRTPGDVTVTVVSRALAAGSDTVTAE